MVSQREEKEIIYIDRRKCGMADEDKRVLDSPDQPEEDKAQENSPPGTTWKRICRHITTAESWQNGRSGSNHAVRAG